MANDQVPDRIHHDLRLFVVDMVSAPRSHPQSPLGREPCEFLLQRADVVHYHIGSQLAPLARAAGLSPDAACSSCGALLVLRLEPDLRVERAVRGRFVCPHCPPDRV